MKFLKPSLGELEIRILETFWSEPGEWDVKTLHRMISKEHKVCLNTIQSTMERLYRKRFLDRIKVSHAYVYSCAKTREEFVSETMQAFLCELNVDESAFISAFLHATQPTSESTLEELITKIKKAYQSIRGSK